MVHHNAALFIVNLTISRVMLEKCFRAHTEKYRHFISKLHSGEDLTKDAFQWSSTQRIASETAYSNCKALNLLADNGVEVGRDLMAMLFNIMVCIIIAIFVCD